MLLVGGRPVGGARCAALAIGVDAVGLDAVGEGDWDHVGLVSDGSGITVCVGAHS